MKLLDPGHKLFHQLIIIFLISRKIIVDKQVNEERTRKAGIDFNALMDFLQKGVSPSLSLIEKIRKLIQPRDFEASIIEGARIRGRYELTEGEIEKIMDWVPEDNAQDGPTTRTPVPEPPKPSDAPAAKIAKPEVATEAPGKGSNCSAGICPIQDDTPVRTYPYRQPRRSHPVKESETKKADFPSAPHVDADCIEGLKKLVDALIKELHTGTRSTLNTVSKRTGLSLESLHKMQNGGVPELSQIIRIVAAQDWTDKAKMKLICSVSQMYEPSNL